MKTHSHRILLALLIFSFPCLGQLSNGGEVAEVIDGRTMIVATGGGRVKVELQFIRVPAAGEQLYDTVKDHLQRMLVGKAVEFKPRVILADRVVGRVLLNNVDVSQQMLRDGAASHAPRETSGQDKNDFDVYASLEAAAKTEMRGVWSIAGITATRSENVNADRPRPVLAAVSRKGSSPVPVAPDGAQLLESWVSSLQFDGKAAAGIKTHTDPAGAYTLILTPLGVLEFASEGGKQTVECRAIYVAASSLEGRGEPLFALGFRSSPKGTDLLKGAGSMTVVAERYVVPLGSLSGSEPRNGVDEIKYYRISKGFLMRIANTRSVELQIDGFKATLSEDVKELFKQLLSATE